MNGFAIRPYRDADAEAMARLYYDSARTLGARRYSPEQVAAWAPAPLDPADVRRRAADGRITLVAVDDADQVIAYGDLEADGHIDHLYCSPDAAGSGAAGAVLDALLARAEGLPRLYVEASELARGLFERKGFVVERRRDFEVRGVAIHNYAMARRLGA
jgi:putative acetyltransferase